MTLKMFGVIASVSVVALTLSTLEASARGGRGGVPGAPIVRPGVKPFMHHHGRGFGGGFFPGGGFYYGDGSYGDGSYGGPLGGTSLPMTIWMSSPASRTSSKAACSSATATPRIRPRRK